MWIENDVGLHLNQSLVDDDTVGEGRESIRVIIALITTDGFHGIRSHTGDPHPPQISK